MKTEPTPVYRVGDEVLVLCTVLNPIDVNGLVCVNIGYRLSDDGSSSSSGSVGYVHPDHIKQITKATLLVGDHVEWMSNKGRSIGVIKCIEGDQAWVKNSETGEMSGRELSYIRRI